MCKIMFPQDGAACRGFFTFFLSIGANKEEGVSRGL